MGEIALHIEDLSDFAGFEIPADVLVALHEGHRANLVLLEDAVYAGKKGQAPAEMPIGGERMPNGEELLKAAILEGLTVRACRVCCSERGVSENEMIDGVAIGSMLDLVNWVVESDRALFW